MKIFVPYTEIPPATLASIEPYEYAAVEMIDKDDYLHYFIQRWREGESFINCEHDVVFGRGSIESLETCPEEWCAFGTDVADSFVDGTPPTLGLTKFSAEFIREYPDVWDEMLIDSKKPPSWRMPTWRYCDNWLREHVDHYVCHQHFPMVFNAQPIGKDGTVFVGVE